ncbi:MAG: cydB [Glaciihabitans sp.]|nr:cydB [Glaciihabitans sp.]
MEILPTVWFIAIAFLWIGYLILEGFDLGVGMHMLFTGKNNKHRRVMLNTIGPVWDGNEVWLITAGAATFAAFPDWYASLLSTLYLPTLLLLFALIFRAVAIEWRGKGTSARWVRTWDLALGLGSFFAAFCVGALLVLTTTGLPLNENGDRVGGPFVWLTPYAILGGLAVVGFCLVHSAAFLALKSDGPVRHRSRAFFVRSAPVLLLPIIAWVLIIQFQHGKLYTFAIVLVAVVAVVWAWINGRAGREGRAFIGMAIFIVAGAASIFANVYPVVLPSTIDSAFDLTVANASSAPYTLGVMSWVAGFALPLIIAYQSWSYWVFRRRVSDHHIPEAHSIIPAILKVK